MHARCPAKLEEMSLFSFWKEAQAPTGWRQNLDLCVPESECHLLCANHRCSADKIFCLKWLHWRFAAPSLPLASLLLLLFWLLFFKEAVNPLCARLYWGEGGHAGGSSQQSPSDAGGAPLLGMEESDPQVRVRTLCPGPGLLELLGTVARLLSASLRAKLPPRAVAPRSWWRSHSPDFYVCSPSG